MRYYCGDSNEIHVYGSDQLSKLFTKTEEAFWGDKPKFKKFIPSYLTEDKGSVSNYYYLAFYADYGCP